MGPGRQRRRTDASSPWALRALGVLSWDLRCRGEGTGAMAGPENLAGEVSIVSNYSGTGHIFHGHGRRK